MGFRIEGFGFRARYKHLRFMAGFRVWGERVLELRVSFVKDSCRVLTVLGFRVL